MTHPVLSERRHLILYLLCWLPGGALLGTVLVFVGELDWIPALALSIPLAWFFAFICLAAWYPSRQAPLTAGSLVVPAVKHLIAAALSSALGQLAGGLWAGVLTRIPTRFGIDWSGLESVFRQQAPLLFAMGVLVYLLAVAACYLIITVEDSRRAEVRALEAEKVQALAARDLELARTIQQKLLPPAERTGDGWRLGARNLAARFVAGDFFDYFPLADGSLMVAIGDVSGKGIGASLVTATVKAVLPLLAADGDVAATLRRLNERLSDELDRRTFVALSLTRFDPIRGRIEIANAGLPDPYVLRSGRPARALEVPQPRLPLGLRRDVAYTRIESELAPGERLLMLTDGLPEAPILTDDPDSVEPLGYEALEHALVATTSPEAASPEVASPEGWLRDLFERLRGATTEELADDWTAVVLERGAIGPDGIGPDEPD